MSLQELEVVIITAGATTLAAGFAAILPHLLRKNVPNEKLPCGRSVSTEVLRQVSLRPVPPDIPPALPPRQPLGNDDAGGSFIRVFRGIGDQPARAARS